MLVPVLALVEIIETIFGKPSSLAVNLSFDASFMLVHKRKGTAEIFFAVGVEVLFVSSNGLSHLLLLHLVDVQLLATVVERLVSFVQL